MIASCADQIAGLFSIATDGLWKLVWHVLPAVCGVLLGGLVVNRFFVRQANIAGFVDRACDRLRELKDLCAEYWTTLPSKSNRGECEIAEAKIKAGLLHVNALVGMLKGKYRCVSLVTEASILKLHDDCTGGAFESQNRKPDKRQFLKIARSIDHLSAELMKLKL